MTKNTPAPMPSPQGPEVPPVPMPTVSNDGPPPVDMPVSSPSSVEWPEETVEAVRLAERSAQRSVCNIPDPRPAVLDEALERRVEVNLAQYDGGDVRRVGSTDPTVRELEAPWSRKARRAAGSIDHHTQEGQS